jgi:hypothetical protein
LLDFEKKLEYYNCSYSKLLLKIVIVQNCSCSKLILKKQMCKERRKDREGQGKRKGAGELFS